MKNTISSYETGVSPKMQENQINTAQITNNPSGKFRKMRD